MNGIRRWFRPGIGVKRWLFVVFVGELCLALAGALLLRAFYDNVKLTGPVQQVVEIVTLQFVPQLVRGIILITVGVVLFALGSFRLIQVLVGPFLAPESDQPLVEVIYQKRFLARGPRIVAIGGGTGLSTLLRGLKEHSSNITAIVTVADDGGSSGRLREQLGIPAVGDIRNCLVALADAEPLMGELLQYRFAQHEGSLAGHAVGNLLIAAMVAVDDGDFEEGVRQMNRVLAVRGQVVPASAGAVTLHARLVDGSEVEGQSRIARMRDIDRVWLSPDDLPASEDAIRAIEDADVIVIGPGSLFTSILPSLLMPELRNALVASTGLRIFVCNVATQAGETEGLDLAAHVTALERHTQAGVLDIVLANNQFSARAIEGWRGEPVRLAWPPPGRAVSAPRLVLEDVVNPTNAHHHDPTRLAAAILRAYEREGGARRRSGAVRSA